MSARIVISGQSQCESFAEICLVADYLAQKLPDFCYERIEKSVLEWMTWLCKINQKNKWHHTKSPLVWKELLMKGSKPYYIGGASDFLDYCHSYYKFDVYLGTEKFEGLIDNYGQYQKKVNSIDEVQPRNNSLDYKELPIKTNFVITISGAGNPLTMHLISGLLEMSTGEKCLSRIFIYDTQCSQSFMEYVEKECSYVGTNHPGKIVKYVEKIGMALTSSDLLIILDHVPLDPEVPIGSWLHANKKIMQNLALVINASASRKMYILFPNLGPACYNATILLNCLTNPNKYNTVVATSDLGLEIAQVAAEITEVPMRNMFCSPVWGFVGVNHLVDIRTTFHKYSTFEPYNRYTRVKNSSLQIGSLSSELRTMEYLTFFDETLWLKVAEKKSKLLDGQVPLNKAVAVLKLVKIWLFDINPDHVVSLGILSNGSFGINFKGVFSQPARFIDGEWKPDTDYLLPKDPQININYLAQIAEITMKLEPKDLPKVTPFYPCLCKQQLLRKKF